MKSLQFPLSLIALCALMLLVLPARADETPAPGEKPNAPAKNAPAKTVAGKPVTLKIRAVKGLGESSLQIPRKVIKIVDPHGDAGADVQSRGISPTQTVVAGLALSAALGLGGVQLARRRSRAAMILIAAVTLGAGLLTATHVMADRTPGPRVDRNPPANPKPVAKDEPKGRTVAMPAVVQIMEQGEVVELSIDLDRAKELLAIEKK